MIRWLKRRFRKCIFPVNELLALIPASTRLLDIGCGQGQFLKSVAVHRTPVALAGLEIDERLIQIACKQLEKVTSVPVKLEVYDGSRFPGHLADYDVISMVDVLHHIPGTDQKAFLEELFVRMSSGALLVLKDIDASRTVLCAFNKLHDLVLSGGVGFERSREWTTVALLKTGFRVTNWGERRILVYPHYWILAVKP